MSERSSQNFFLCATLHLSPGASPGLVVWEADK